MCQKTDKTVIHQTPTVGVGDGDDGDDDDDGGGRISWQHPTPIPSRPGIKYPVRHPPHFDKAKMPTYKAKMPTYKAKMPTYKTKMPTYEPKMPTYKTKMPMTIQK